MFDYGDCAIEVLQDCQRQKTVNLDFDVEQVIDALTPAIMLDSGDSVALNYAKYRSMSEDIRKQMDKEQWATIQRSSPS